MHPHYRDYGTVSNPPFASNNVQGTEVRLQHIILFLLPSFLDIHIDHTDAVFEENGMFWQCA